MIIAQVSDPAVGGLGFVAEGCGFSKTQAPKNSKFVSDLPGFYDLDKNELLYTFKFRSRLKSQLEFQPPSPSAGCVEEERDCRAGERPCG